MKRKYLIATVLLLVVTGCRAARYGGTPAAAGEGDHLPSLCARDSGGFRVVEMMVNAGATESCINE